MDCKQKITELREQTGMNRKEFCDYFLIPYRTVTEWERGNRNAPEYVLRMIEYVIRMEKLGVIDTVEEQNTIFHPAIDSLLSGPDKDI